MGKLVESTFITLDGVISDPQVWGPQYWDEEHQGYSLKLMDGVGHLLLGRETYEGFAEVWPTMENPYADRLNALPKSVASRTLKEAKWNASVIDGDVAEAVAELKKADHDILKFGTGELDLTLLESGLLDELHLWVFPVIAGRGQRVLEGVDTTHFGLVDSVEFASGIVVHVLRPTTS